MKNKVLAALAVGGLLVGAGLVVAFVSAPATASAQDDTDTTDDGRFPRVLGFFEDVIDGLVGDGIIDQDQADAILEATEEKATELREEREATHDLLRRFLEDDTITEEEASQLPEEHPLLSDRYDEAWADGQITRDELRPFSRREFFKRGLRSGALLDDGGIDQEEYDSLDDDHPLKQVDVSEYLADGLITPDELREIHQEFHAARADENA